MASPLDMLRVGGFLPIAAASLAALALIVVVAGYVLAFITRRRPQGKIMRFWRGSVLTLGFAGISVGVVGVAIGLTNLLRAAVRTDWADLRVMVQAISQMSLCPAAGLVAALVAFVGYFTVLRIVSRER
jgi:hypothetical protein